jgi:3-hydroxyisobutyrate dehydrogenase-like beta-hydroxyacid dehydrogenase
MEQSVVQRVGFLGLGRMGSAMARNILKGGFKVVVYNRTASKMQPLIEAGAESATSPREAVTGVDVVVTSLTDDQSVLQTVTGELGILAGIRAGCIHIGTSTIAPTLAGHLAELHAQKGTSYIAAPVLGRPTAAEAAQLTAFVAGKPEAVAQCHGVLDTFCQNVVYVGEVQAIANSLKLAVNYLVVSSLDLMGQVYAFGEKSGIQPELLEQVMATMFGHPALQEYAVKIRTRKFGDVGFDLLSGLKDVQLMLQASTDTRVALSNANHIREKFLAAIANDMGTKDWSAIYEITRMNAGLK